MRRHFLLSVWLVLLPAFAYGQSISVVWNANPPEDQVTGYEVCISTTPLSCNVERASVPSAETSYAFTPSPGVLYRFAVRAVNAAGPGAYTSEVTASIPALTQPPNQTSTLNNPISPLTLSASDPDGSALQFSHSGLPFGLSLNSNTGVITGTPTSPGAFNVTVFVSDNLETTSRTFVWTIQGNGGSDSGAPALAISSHTSGQTVTTSSITLAGTASDGGSGGSGIVSVTVNGATATGGTASGSNTANWSRNVSLSTGANTLTVVATDGAGNVRTSTLTITRTTGTDTTAPTLAITSHTSGQTVSASSITLYGTASDSGSGGSGIASVTVNGSAATGGTVSGNNTAAWSRSLTLSAGTNTISVVARDGAGNARTSTITLTLSAPAASPGVSAVSATPSSGSGATQTFSLQYSDSSGATRLSTAWVWFNATFGSVSSDSCMLYYQPSTATLYLLTDAANFWMPATAGSNVTLQNSQCAVDVRSSGGTVSGTTLTLNLAMTFRSTYAGAKHVYMYAANVANVNSGWQDRGDWTATSTGSTTPSSPTAPTAPSAPTTPTVTADSATPSSGTGSTQVFSLQYSSTRGATDLLHAWVWFSATFSDDSTYSCMLYYDRSIGRLRMLNNGSTWMSGSLGGSGTLWNSQCSVNLGSSSVTFDGNTLTLNLAMTFRSQYRGAKNIYMYAANLSGVNSGWRHRGLWTVP